MMCDFSQVLDEFRRNGRDSELMPEWPAAPLRSLEDLRQQGPPRCGLDLLAMVPPPPPPPQAMSPPWSRPSPSPPSSRSSRQAARRRNKAPTHCVFCKNNNELPCVYRTHVLKDGTGLIRCPVLRAYTCPTCGACGDHAHTIKYCPLRQLTPPPDVAGAESASPSAYHCSHCVGWTAGVGSPSARPIIGRLYC